MRPEHYALLLGDSVRIEGWVQVCELFIPQTPKGANNYQDFTIIPWQPRFCVVRTDEQSLICYKNEQASNRVSSRYLPRIRLDGFEWAFVSSQFYPSHPPPIYEHIALMESGSETMPYRHFGDSVSLCDEPNFYSTLPVIHGGDIDCYDTSYDLIDDVRSESLDRRRAIQFRPRAMPSPSYGQGLTLCESPTTPQKLANFLSRHNPLKRTKSVSKLDHRTKRNTLENEGPARIPLAPLHNQEMHLYPSGSSRNNMRASRSHESLLSYSTTTHMIDLGATDAPQLMQLHPSVLGTPNCFQISTPAGATKYYQCRTAAERERWMESVRRTMYPQQDQTRRTENSLQIWIQEAKGVPAKRKYFCELCFDKTLYARTSSKFKSEICFWGEQFEFNHLPWIETVCINLYRDADRKKKKDRSTLIGLIEIPMSQLTARHPVERWYTVNGAEKSSASKGETAAIRVRARYQTVTILPLRVYDGLLNFLQVNYLPLCLALEPVLSVKAKEDFATCLVRVLHKQQMAKDFLCDLIMAEIEALDNEHLMFRGNSIATKAMEAYMKLVADHYLQETLGEFVRSVLDSEDDCEVDPLRLINSNLSVLDSHQKLLTFHVEAAWGKIINSAYQFPQELRQVFQEIRHRLTKDGRGELSDKLISSNIFLRFLCPAILSPSMFNLVIEYPNGRGARNLTLIAKALQTLANFTKFGGKEHYMEFMNIFVDREWDNMKQFLRRISTPSPYSRRDLVWEGHIDLGKELSLLHTYLVESWNSQNNLREFSGLSSILESLSEFRSNPHFNSFSSDTPLSPISDYDNASPSNDRLHSFSISSVNSQSRTPPAHDLTTSDDYVLDSALNENVQLRAAGYRVQQSRNHSRQTMTARDAVSGRSDDLIYVDESTLLADKSLDLSNEETCRPVDQATVSSGYQSMNHSSNCSSSSSSPVERQMQKTPKEVSKPLSIANPLYSMQCVPVPLVKQRQACQSLPDIQAVPEQFSLRDSVLTPDSSFDDSPSVPQWVVTKSSQNVGALSTSLSPQALQSILGPSAAQNLPRTNPRYYVGRSVRLPNHGAPGSTPRAAIAPQMRRAKTSDTLTPPDPGNAARTPEPEKKLKDTELELEKTKERLRDAEIREISWKEKYEGARPRWNEHVKPILERLKLVELELQDELTTGQQKQQIIHAQQRKIESLLEANQKLMISLRRRGPGTGDCDPLLSNGLKLNVDSAEGSLESLSMGSSLSEHRSPDS